MRRAVFAKGLIAFLAVLLVSKSANAWMMAFGIALAVLGILSGIAVVLATDDGEPEIGAIRIVVDPAQNADWYVGQQRLVTVEADVSFGHIRGSDVGVITLELDFNGDVEIRESRRYTEKNDGDSDTETLGRWEGTIVFAVRVEATDHGIGSVGAKITVDGESDGLFSDSAVTVSAYESLSVEVLYPLERQSSSQAIGWLDPASDTLFHVECFDQALEVRNRATVHGQVGTGRISHSSAQSVPFEAASTNATPAVTEIVEGPVGHDNSVVHFNSVNFKTDWTLQGSGNIRLFLETGSDWLDDGGAGPSSQDNTCDGGAGNCTLIDTNRVPILRDVDSTYVLEILARNQPRRVASSREVLVTDTSGFSKGHTTNGLGEFAISEIALGPLVGIDLVAGADAALFEPKSLAGVNVELLDSSVSPTFQSFAIMEAEAPPVQGSAVDGLGNPVRSDLFAVDGGGTETYLGRFSGPISIPGGLDLSTLGFPSATLRVKPRPAFNRDYLVNQLEAVHATDVEVIDLGVLVFEESPLYQGPVTFRGRFEIREPDGLIAGSIAGLSLWIEGVGAVLADSEGNFEVVVPFAGSPRSVRLENAPALTTADGDPLSAPGATEVEIEFGRSGPVLDLGVVTLHAATPSSTVPLLEPAVAAVLVALLASAGFLFVRRWRAST